MRKNDQSKIVTQIEKTSKENVFKIIEGIKWSNSQQVYICIEEGY